jgi:type II secretory pathway pseudopilin PulG
MERRRTSLERGLTIVFGLVILVMLLIVPVVFLAINGIVSQAEVLQHRVIAGQLAYARVAADADTLRAATVEAATDPDPLQAISQLQIAKALVKQFPDDARAMVRIFCPTQAYGNTYQDDGEISCAKNQGSIAEEIGRTSTRSVKARAFTISKRSRQRARSRKATEKLRSRRPAVLPRPRIRSRAKTAPRCSTH